MITTIEKIAKALYELAPIYQQETDPDWRPIGPAYSLTWEQASEQDDVLEHYQAQARAALDALLEPSEGMVRSVNNWPEHWGPYEDADPAYRAAYEADCATTRSDFTAAIQHALDEGVREDG